MAAAGSDRNTFICEWEIENFSVWRRIDIKRDFTAFNLDETRWCLVLAYNVLTPTLIHCQLRRDPAPRETRQLVIGCKIVVADIDDNIFESFEFTEDSAENDRVVPLFTINATELLDYIARAPKDTLRIVCTLESSEPSSASPDCHRCKAKTKFATNQNGFTVDVPLPVTTEPMASFAINNVDFVAKIFSEINDTVIQIECQDYFPQYLKCQISLLGNDGEPKKCHEDYRLFLKERELWKIPSFFTVAELLNNREVYLQNDTLFSLKFKLTFASEAKAKESILYLKNKTKYETDQCLKKDLHSMLKDPTYADVQLRVGDKIFPAHKGVLAARSPVFHVMFKQDMRESKTGCVDCPDLEADTIAAFLNFIYTGTGQNISWASSLKLMMAGNQYDVPSLVEECSDYLMSALSIDNVCEVVKAADLIGHERLKKASMDLFMRNADRILSTPRWLDWLKDNVCLGSEMLCKLSIHMKTLIPNK